MESDSWYSKSSLVRMVGHSVGQGPHLVLFLFVRLLIVSSDDKHLLFPTEQQKSVLHTQCNDNHNADSLNSLHNCMTLPSRP